MLVQWMYFTGQENIWMDDTSFQAVVFNWSGFDSYCLTLCHDWTLFSVLFIWIFWRKYQIIRWFINWYVFEFLGVRTGFVNTVFDTFFMVFCSCFVVFLYRYFLFSFLFRLFFFLLVFLCNSLACSQRHYLCFMSGKLLGLRMQWIKGMHKWMMTFNMK